MMGAPTGTARRNIRGERQQATELNSGHGGCIEPNSRTHGNDELGPAGTKRRTRGTSHERAEVCGPNILSGFVPAVFSAPARTRQIKPSD